jgi:enoyl-CoA hydratase
MAETPNPSDTPLVSVERRDHVAVVWLDRPETKNALPQHFWVEFPEVVDALGADPDVHVLVVAGRGSAFTVGLDVVAYGPAMLGGSIDDAAPPAPSPVAQRMANYRTIKAMQRTFSSLADCPKPVIAAVHGWCIGAGIDLITACDIRYASADAKFSVRETKLALVADVGTLQRLPGIVDPGWVAEIVYTGRDFSAEEALEMGLVTRVLPDQDAVVKESLSVAEAIAANSPLSVQGSKQVLRAGGNMTVEDHLDYVALWNAAFLHSDDLAEAFAAFAERRDPEFEGK